jgi:hypothetical protein
MRPTPRAGRSKRVASIQDLGNRSGRPLIKENVPTSCVSGLATNSESQHSVVVQLRAWLRIGGEHARSHKVRPLLRMWEIRVNR